MNSALAKLPQLTIDRVVTQAGLTEASGTFDSLKCSADRWLGYLVASDDESIKGRFFGLAAENRRVIFRPSTAAGAALLSEGKRYAYLDGYWGERVALVLDRSRRWIQKSFEPEDAVETVRPSGHRWRGRARDRHDGPWVAVPGGWDHEHCAICWAHVVPSAAGGGNYTDGNDWVCSGCFARYVEPRSLAFLDDRAVAQVRGDT